MIDRRTALAAAGAALAAARLPARDRVPDAGILLFDPRSVEALAIARRTKGKRLIALTGDPMRQWRAMLAGGRQPIDGLTTWSDFVLLRELARDSNMRVTSETHLPAAGQALLVRWTAA